MGGEGGEQGGEREPAAGQQEHVLTTPAIRNRPAGQLQQGVADEKGRKDPAEEVFRPAGLFHDDRRGHRDVHAIDVVDDRAAKEQGDHLIAYWPYHTPLLGWTGSHSTMD